MNSERVILKFSITLIKIGVQDEHTAVARLLRNQAASTRDDFNRASRSSILASLNTRHLNHPEKI